MPITAHEISLKAAIKQDNLDTLYHLLTQPEPHKLSLPHEAAKVGAERIFSYFLENSAYFDCFALDHEGMSPFDRALEGGHLDLAQTLYDTGQVDPRGALDAVRQFTGSSQRAAELWAWVKQLPDFENTILNREINGNAPILDAAFNKKNGVFFITAMLTEYPEQLNLGVKNEYGDYIPHAFISHLEEMQVLPTLKLVTEVMRKRDLLSYLDQWRNFRGYTALTLAALQGFITVVRFLVEDCGVDIRLRDSSGKTAREIAIVVANNPSVSTAQRTNCRDIADYLARKEAALDQAARAPDEPTLTQKKLHAHIAALQSKAAEHDWLLQSEKEKKAALAIIQNDRFLNPLYHHFTHLFTIALQAQMMLFSGVLARAPDTVDKLAGAVNTLGTIPIPFMHLAASLASSGIETINAAIVDEKIKTIAAAFNANTLSEDIEVAARTFALFIFETLTKDLQDERFAKPFAKYILRCFLNFIEVSDHAWTSSYSFFQRLLLALHEHEGNYGRHKHYHSLFLETLTIKQLQYVRAIILQTPIMSDLQAAYAFYPQVYRTIAQETSDFAMRATAYTTPITAFTPTPPPIKRQGSRDSSGSSSPLSTMDRSRSSSDGSPPRTPKDSSGSSSDGSPPRMVLTPEASPPSVTLVTSGKPPLAPRPAPALPARPQGNPYLSPALQAIPAYTAPPVYSPPTPTLQSAPTLSTAPIHRTSPLATTKPTASPKQEPTPEELLKKHKDEVATAIAKFYETRRQKRWFNGISEDESKVITRLQLEVPKTKTPDDFIDLVRDIRTGLKHPEKELGQELANITWCFDREVKDSKSAILASRKT